MPVPNTAKGPIDLSSLARGFADPVLESQSIFRTLMDVMSRPGTIGAPALALEAPDGLSRAATAVLLTLADFETPVWLPEPLAQGPAGSYVRFHCGSPLVGDATEAMFAVSAAQDAGDLLRALPSGDDAYPDRSATLVVEVPSLVGGTAVRLKGPGIDDHIDVRPAGVGAAFWAAVAANAARFPLGVDIVFTSGERFAALPRSTTVSRLAESG